MDVNAKKVDEAEKAQSSIPTAHQKHWLHFLLSFTQGKKQGGTNVFCIFSSFLFSCIFSPFLYLAFPHPQISRFPVH